MQWNPYLLLYERRFEQMVKRIKHNSDLIFEIEKKLDELGIPDPHLFLCDIMAGHDPRGNGQLYVMMENAEKEEDLDGKPSAEDWQAIKDLVFGDPKYHGESVTLNDSVAAAKEALAYMYPKKKAVEVTGNMEHLVKVVPLTKEEIDLFEKRFMDEV
jgi:hypothetical protein